jgi:hypothetical protein
MWEQTACGIQRQQELAGNKLYSSDPEQQVVWQDRNLVLHVSFSCSVFQ